MTSRLIGPPIALSILLLLHLAPMIEAQQTAPPPPTHYAVREWEGYLRESAKQLKKTSRVCTCRLVDPKNGTPAWASKEKVKITIVFGYSDNRLDEKNPDVVIDQYLLIAFLKYMLQSGGDLAITGFESANFDPSDLVVNGLPDKAYIVRKTIGGTTFEIHLRQSSLSDSHKINESDKKTGERQKNRSRAAQEAIFNGVINSDAVFYLGHILNGNFIFERPDGPSKEIKGDFLSQLDKSTAKVVGFFGCNSNKLVKLALDHSKFGGTLIGSTEKMYYTSLMHGLFSTLDSILSGRCNTAFEQSVTKDIKIGGLEDRGFCLNKPLFEIKCPEPSPATPLTRPTTPTSTTGEQPADTAKEAGCEEIAELEKKGQRIKKAIEALRSEMVKKFQELQRDYSEDKQAEYETLSNKFAELLEEQRKVQRTLQRCSGQ